MSAPPGPVPGPAVREAAAGLADAAVALVREPSGAVRAEDYLTVLAAATGEAALVGAGLFDVETTDLVPGSHVFGDAVNEALSGDSDDAASAPVLSVVGLLVAELVPDVVRIGDFGSLAERFVRAAGAAGTVAWGEVPLDVPDDHRPRVIPLRAAFELRGPVQAAVDGLGTPPAERHVVVAVALARALAQVRGALEPAVALHLALDVVFGTAKLVPVPRHVVEEHLRAARAEALGDGAGERDGDGDGGAGPAG